MNGVHTLLFVQGSRAAGRGKCFVWSPKGEHFWSKLRLAVVEKKKHTLIFSNDKYFQVKIASLANLKSCVTVGPIH